MLYSSHETSKESTICNHWKYIDVAWHNFCIFFDIRQECGGYYTNYCVYHQYYRHILRSMADETRDKESG